VIPPETRVDPARFPETGFPVHCPACEYQLQGLAGHRCPECGRAYERGRLLVEQYLLQQGTPLPPMGKLARTGCLVGWFMVIAAGFAYGAMLSRTETLTHTNRFFAATLAVFAIAACFTFGCSVVWGRFQERQRTARREQSRQVYEALDWSDPVLARAQWTRWTLFPSGYSVLAAAALYDFVRSSRYAVDPRSLALLILIAILGLIAWSSFRHWGPQRKWPSAGDPPNAPCA